jgi:hypothetical protein
VWHTRSLHRIALVTTINFGMLLHFGTEGPENAAADADAVGGFATNPALTCHGAVWAAGFFYSRPQMRKLRSLGGCGDDMMIRCRAGITFLLRLGRRGDIG